MKIFRVSRIYWEDYEPYDLIGPDHYSKEEFQKLCDSLLHDAVETAIKVEQAEEYPCYVGWSEIVEQLVVELTKHGFQKVELIEAEYRGTAIIRENSAHESQVPESIIKELSEHNEKVRRGSYQ